MTIVWLIVWVLVLLVLLAGMMALDVSPIEAWRAGIARVKRWWMEKNAK